MSSIYKHDRDICNKFGPPLIIRDFFDQEFLQSFEEEMRKAEWITLTAVTDSSTGIAEVKHVPGVPGRISWKNVGRSKKAEDFFDIFYKKSREVLELHTGLKLKRCNQFAGLSSLNIPLGYHVDNSHWLQEQNIWYRNFNEDFSSVLWLGQGEGALVDFPEHGISFLPEHGTALLFPSGLGYIHGSQPLISGSRIVCEMRLNTIT